MILCRDGGVDCENQNGERLFPNEVVQADDISHTDDERAARDATLARDGTYAAR